MRECWLLNRKEYRAKPNGFYIPFRFCWAIMGRRIVGTNLSRTCGAIWQTVKDVPQLYNQSSKSLFLFQVAKHTLDKFYWPNFHPVRLFKFDEVGEGEHCEVNMGIIQRKNGPHNYQNYWKWVKAYKTWVWVTNNESFMMLTILIGLTNDWTEALKHFKSILRDRESDIDAGDKLSLAEQLKLFSLKKSKAKSKNCNFIWYNEGTGLWLSRWCSHVAFNFTEKSKEKITIIYYGSRRVQANRMK